MVALLLSRAHAQTSTKEDPRFAGLDKEFNAILNTWHVAGFAVAVVEKATLTLTFTMGVQQLYVPGTGKGGGETDG